MDVIGRELEFPMAPAGKWKLKGVVGSMTPSAAGVVSGGGEIGNLSGGASEG